jgi:AraC-like DNA-binding protein
LFQGPLVCVGLTRCAGRAAHEGGEEGSGAHAVAFPRRGVFLRESPAGRALGHPGQAVFFNRDEPYRVRHPVAEGDECLVVTIREDALVGALATQDPRVEGRPRRPFRHPVAPVAEQTALLAERLLATVRRREATALQVEDEALHLVTAATDCRGEGARVRTATERRHADLAEAARSLLVQEPGRAWSLERLAGALDTSPFHLSRVFRRHTGSSPHRYLTRVRLCSALARLAEGEPHLATLAQALGFCEHSHLTRAFRRGFGHAPASVREALRAGARG